MVGGEGQCQSFSHNIMLIVKWYAESEDNFELYNKGR